MFKRPSEIHPALFNILLSSVASLVISGSGGALLLATGWMQTGGVVFIWLVLLAQGPLVGYINWQFPPRGPQIEDLNFRVPGAILGFLNGLFVGGLIGSTLDDSVGGIVGLAVMSILGGYLGTQLSVRIGDKLKRAFSIE